MAAVDPMKSVMSIVNVDDTSLALPSTHQLRSGQQRVLQQVQTIRKTKSRTSSSRSGSAPMSPTSPVFEPVFVDTLKSPLSSSNGSVFFANGFSNALTLEKNHNRQAMNKFNAASVKKNTTASTFQYGKSYGPVGVVTMGQTNTSRSEPELPRQRTMPKRSAPSQGIKSHRATQRADRAVSHFITTTVSQPQLLLQSSPPPVYPPNGNGVTRANSQFVNGSGVNRSNSQFVNGSGVNRSNSQFVNGSGVTRSNSQFVTSTSVSRPTSQFLNDTITRPHSEYVDGSGGTKLNSEFINGSGVNRSNSQFVNGTGMTKSKSQIVNGTGVTKSNTQFVSSPVPKSKSSTKLFITPEQPSTKTKAESGSNGTSLTAADLTMKEAVEYLSHDNESLKHCGASFIQHNTFVDENAKEEVLKLDGVSPLVSLLRSPSPQVHQTASAALRNLSFKSINNKLEIERCGGITEAAALLRETDSVEVQRQLTGLLWNLSSVDSLKPDLLKTALPVLMDRIILPYKPGPDQTGSSSTRQDPEVFFHATECLKNLSCAKQSNRQAMRKYRGLVDTLASYVRDSIDEGNQDDKTVENCVCILHNLSFQLEAEAPALFSRITSLAKTVNRTPSQQGDASPIGCFSPQGKATETERHFDFPVAEDPNPKGAGWLFHSKTLQSYLDLLGTCQREETQEACCGAMQNLTTHKTIVSSVISQLIVQKLNGLQVLSPLIKSNKVNLQRNTVALIGNLTRNSNLHNAIARKALPDLLGIISAGTNEGNESDDTLAMACQAANCLLMKEPDMGKHLLNNNLINSLQSLSQNDYFPKSKKAASLLLFNLWSEKDLQSVLKKKGMVKSSFINDVTTAVHKSIQIVD